MDRRTASSLLLVSLVFLSHRGARLGPGRPDDLRRLGVPGVRRAAHDPAIGAVAAGRRRDRLGQPRDHRDGRLGRRRRAGVRGRRARHRATHRFDGGGIRPDRSSIRRPRIVRPAPGPDRIGQRGRRTVRRRPVSAPVDQCTAAHASGPSASSCLEVSATCRHHRSQRSVGIGGMADPMVVITRLRHPGRSRRSRAIPIRRDVVGATAAYGGAATRSPRAKCAFHVRENDRFDARSLRTTSRTCLERSIPSRCRAGTSQRRSTRAEAAALRVMPITAGTRVRRERGTPRATLVVAGGHA